MTETVMTQGIPVIDSHTGGEPTRVVIGNVSEADVERYRRAILCEPRGHEVIVGALLSQPKDAGCVARVTFFNNVGLLGMCGHGMIGVVATLAYQGKIGAGEHHFETSVGNVSAVLHDSGCVSVRNVLSYRKVTGLRVNVPGLGEITGDVSWGGNWFFLVQDDRFSIRFANVRALTEASLAIRTKVREAGYPEVDHVELFGPPEDPTNDSRNFVLCPGGEYDRSPCGTGTSAKLACLAADGKLAPGATWRQESVIGSVFQGAYEVAENGIIPTITGRAFITAESRLIFQPNDPFQWGIS